MKRQRAPQQRLSSMGRALAASVSFGTFCLRAKSTAVAAAEALLPLADEPFTLTEGSALYWVKAADTREGHAAACLRNGLDPTPPDIFLPDQTLPALQAAEQAEEAPEGAASSTPRNASSSDAATPPPARPLWSENLVTVVANGLGLELERPGGLAGCCVPGMWCGPRGCYTLAFGDTFSNYGGYVGVPPDDYSIYTCKEPSVPLAAPADSSTPAPAVNGSDPGDAASAPGSTTAALPTLSPTAPAAEVEEKAGDGSPAPPVRPTIVSVGPEVVKAGEALMVVGSGFGEAVSDVRVMVGGRDCRDPELCHLVCRPCGEEDRCEFDEMCMEDGLSKEKVCLPICDGTEGSCPCDHRCLPKRFELQGEPHSMVVNLCRPPDADPNFLCHGSVLREQERIQCTVPVLVWDQAETESSDRAGAGLGQKPPVRRGRHLDGDGRRGGERVEGRGVVEGEGEEEEEEEEEGGGGELSAASFSLSVGDRGAVWEGSVEYAPRDCHSAEDCDDGDACSFDACVEGSCVHTGVQEGYGCQAQPVHATWRGDTYRYFQIVDRADPVEQAEFVAEVRAQNKLSSVTFADDYPVEFHNWREFPVYGTKYEDVYISPNGALFVPPLQTVVPGGLSAVSPSTEAYFPVLKADWNPSDSRAASSVLVMIEEDQFSVLYQDVFLFKRSASATPSTFSTTVFPDGSLRYRYMRIGDKADWTAGVSGNSFVSPTIRNRHVRQSQFIQMDENGLPSAAAPSEAFSATPTPPPSPGAPASTASNSSDSTSGDDASEVQGEGGGSAVTIIANGDGAEEEDGDTEVTLCRAPTLACLARACGKAGSEVPVLWEGVGCRAAASLNVTFSCRIGGLEVPAVSLEGGATASSSGSLAGGFEEEAWGPDWVGGEGGGGLVCEVPRLEWAEAGQDEAVMVPVEVLWSLPEQASDSAKEQVRLGAAGVGVHGLSVLGDAGLINSHVLAFRYYRDDAEAPDCGCSTSPRQTELTCDSCLVCGGDGSTKDCGGFCHGEASVSPCGECSGGMTGVTGGLWCDEYGEYLDGPAEAALLSLSQSIMMLVALSIMTAFLTMCLFLARALMLRGVLAMEGDRHGTLRRRAFSRHRGLSPSELDCLETVEYSTAIDIVSKDKGNDDNSCAADGGGDSSGVELIGEKVSPTSSRSSSGSEEKGGGVESAGVTGGDDEAFIAQGAEAASSADCAICLGGFEEGDVLRKLPCLHFFHQKCVDEWLHLSVSCPLCKRSAREGLRRNRRRRRRLRAAAEAAAQRAQQHRDSTVPATTATPTRTPTPVGAWFRGLPSSLARLFAHSGDGGGGGGGGEGRGGRRQWQRVDDDGSNGEEKLDDDRGDTGHDEDSPLDGETRRMRVLNANIAAFFGGAEPSPHVSPESLGSSSPGGSSSSSSSSTGSGDGGGDAAVGGRSSALRGLFGRNRFDGGGGRRRGGGGASAEYELAPIGPAAAAAAAAAAVDEGVTRNSDIV